MRTLPEKCDIQQKLFAAYIKTLMRKEGLNQRQISSCFGKSQPWFSRKLNSGEFNVKEMIMIFFLLKADADAVGNVLTMKWSESNE